MEEAAARPAENRFGRFVTTLQGMLDTLHSFKAIPTLIEAGKNFETDFRPAHRDLTVALRGGFMAFLSISARIAWIVVWYVVLYAFTEQVQSFIKMELERTSMKWLVALFFSFIEPY